MAKVKCKNCGATCCQCSGCDTSKYKDNLCPLCQKTQLNAANTKNNTVPGLSVPKRPSDKGRMQLAESF